MSSLDLDTHGVTMLTKIHTGRQARQRSVEDYLLCFQMRRELRQLYFPTSLRTEVWYIVHAHALAKHGRVNSSVEKVSRSYSWPMMRRAAEDYVLTCLDYQQLKPGNTQESGVLQKTF